MPEFQKINYNFNYKTLKCKFFDEKGECKNKDNCNYAHGEEELRAANTNIISNQTNNQLQTYILN